MRSGAPRGLLIVVGLLAALSACGSAGGGTTAPTDLPVPTTAAAAGTGTSAGNSGTAAVRVSSTTAVAAGTVQTGPVTTTAGTADAWVDGTISTTAGPCSGNDRSGRASVYPPTLVVIDAATGGLRWQFCPASPTNGIAAAVAGTTVVFSTGVVRDDGQIDLGIAGFDAATGALRWQTRRPTGLPTVVNDDLVVMPPTAMTGPPATTTVDPATGAPRWHVDGVAAGGFGDAAISTSDVVIGVAEDALVGLDPRDGSERWRIPRVSTVAVTTGGIVGEEMGGTARKVTVFDPTTGKARWTTDGVALTATVRVVIVATVDTTRPPVTLPGTTAMPVPGTTGAPVALPNVTQVRDIVDGHVLWTLERSSPVLDGRNFGGQSAPADWLLLATDNMGLEVHDARTGALAWSRPGPLNVTLADDDTLLVDNGAAAYDTATGKERWQFAVPCIADRAPCTTTSSYVQSAGMHNGLVVLAINDFGGG